MLLELAFLSSCLASPRVGHLHQVKHMFRCIETSPRRRIYVDPDYTNTSEGSFNKCDWEDFYRDAKEDMPLYMPESLRRDMETHVLVDAIHAAEKMSRRHQNGIFSL